MLARKEGRVKEALEKAVRQQRVRVWKGIGRNSNTQHCSLYPQQQQGALTTAKIQHT